MPHSFNRILEKLYEKYYVGDIAHSNVTSSHWCTIGGSNVGYRNGKWIFKGYGFGSAPSRTLVNYITHIPNIFSIRKILNAYQCPLNIRSLGAEISRKSGFLFDFDSVKQVLSLFWILKELPVIRQDGMPLRARGISIVCVIGDGYGFFSSLIKSFDPSVKVICVNLGRILFFDAYAVGCVHKNVSAELISTTTKYDNNKFYFLEAEIFSLLEKIPVDLFVNIASMQEMDLSVIQKYFQLMRSSSAKEVFFYCCNRIEKKLPDNTVIRFFEYPWEESRIIFDELCPWYQSYPISRPPWRRNFDGPIQHRLVQLI